MFLLFLFCWFVVVVVAVAVVVISPFLKSEFSVDINKVQEFVRVKMRRTKKKKK